MVVDNVRVWLLLPVWLIYMINVCVKFQFNTWKWNNGIDEWQWVVLTPGLSKDNSYTYSRVSVGVSVRVSVRVKFP